MKLKNIPNMLSITRIFLVFVFIALFFTNHIEIALLVFLLAGATDVVDGYLARRNNWISGLGKVLDPLADKMMQFTVLICLWIKDFIPWWFVVPFFVKDLFTLFAGLIVIKRRSVAVVSKWYGKLTVCLFYATIVIATICKDFFASHEVLRIILFVPAIGFAIFSLVAYIKHYAYLKNEEPKQGKLLKIHEEEIGE